MVLKLWETDWWFLMVLSLPKYITIRSSNCTFGIYEKEIKLTFTQKPVHKCSQRFSPNSKTGWKKVYISMGKMVKNNIVGEGLRNNMNYLQIPTSAYKGIVTMGTKSTQSKILYKTIKVTKIQKLVLATWQGTCSWEEKLDLSEVGRLTKSK